MEDVFEDFKQRIEAAVKRNMPRDAKLVVLGQISYAVIRDEITHRQADELKRMMGNPVEWEDAMEWAIFGEPLKTNTAA
jgi:thiazole synthase